MRKALIVSCALFMLSFASCALAASQPIDIDGFTTALEIDYSQAAQLPLVGYFTKTLDSGRTMKIYLAPEASIRTYFTVVALPDSTDTTAFLESEGWFNLIDSKGEAMVVLEPGPNGWGSPKEEADYVNAAMGVVRSGMNGNRVPVLSSFGEFYLVGYEEGAGPLEYWAASNPILVISQVYLNGTSNASDLAEAGSSVYDGKNTSGYDPGLSDDVFAETLVRTDLDVCAKSDVPIPTWLIGYDSNSASARYWLNANDCVETASNGVYWQDKASKRPQTLYANSQLTGSHGFSQVRISSVNTTPSASELYAWLSVYTRYDVTFAYSNALAYRLDYTAAKVTAQRTAQDGIVKNTYLTTDWKGNAQNVGILGQSNVTIANHGTVHVGIFAFSDNNGDRVSDPREYLIYVPDGYSNKTLPVLCVYPGNTQTDIIFFDSTQWYQVADKEGIVLAFVCETYNNAVSVTHVDSYLYQTALMSVLSNDINGKLASLDVTRVYATGQSLGSMTTQDMARVNPRFFAAVASTSGNTYAVNDLTFGKDASSDLPIPTMMLTGQSDLPGLMPDLTSTALTTWANYFLNVNGLGRTVGAKRDDYGANEYAFINDRHDVYTWKTGGDVPSFAWGQTLLRPHNCYPSEMPILWDFLKHFSLEADGTRLYSPSGFKESDYRDVLASGDSSGNCSISSLGLMAAALVLLIKR